MNRLETYKHREIAAPVHVNEGGGCFATAILENKGGVEKEKVRPTGSGSAKAAKEKAKRPKFIPFSNKRQKFKTTTKRLHIEEFGALSTRLLDKTHRLRRDHVGAGYCGAHAP